MDSNIQVTFNEILCACQSFLFQGFAFNSVNENAAPQRLKCHIEFCHNETENSPCTTGCFEQEKTTTEMATVLVYQTRGSTTATTTTWPSTTTWPTTTTWSILDNG